MKPWDKLVRAVLSVSQGDQFIFNTFIIYIIYSKQNQQKDMYSVAITVLLSLAASLTLTRCCWKNVIKGALQCVVGFIIVTLISVGIALLWIGGQENSTTALAGETVDIVKRVVQDNIINKVVMP